MKKQGENLVAPEVQTTITNKAGQTFVYEAGQGIPKDLAESMDLESAEKAMPKKEKEIAAKVAANEKAAAKN